MNFLLSELKELVPKSKRSSITDEVVDSINRLVSQNHVPEESRILDEAIMSALVEFKHLLEEGLSLPDYIAAIKYTSYHLNLGYSKQKAYSLTFPEKVHGRSGNAIASMTNSYSNTKAVRLLSEVIGAPIHVHLASQRLEMFQMLRDSALNTDSSLRDRVAAVNTFLTHSAKPVEPAKVINNISNSATVITQVGDEIAKSAHEQYLEHMAAEMKKSLRNGTMTIEHIGSFKPTFVLPSSNGE